MPIRGFAFFPKYTCWSNKSY